MLNPVRCPGTFTRSQLSEGAFREVRSEPAGRAVQCKEKGERGEEGLRGQAAGLVFFTGGRQ